MIQKSISWPAPAFEESELSQDDHISTAVSQVVSGARRFQTKKSTWSGFSHFFHCYEPQKSHKNSIFEFAPETMESELSEV